MEKKTMLHVLRGCFLLILPIVFPPDIFADVSNYQKEGEEFAKGLVKKVRKEDLEGVLNEKEKLKSPKGEAKEGEGCNDCVQNLKNPEELIKSIENELGESEEKILVFVSFSMPAISLKELSREAKKYNARLILRGIYQDSFRRTVEKILETDKKGLSLEINPNLFRQYRIQKVPTFVLIKGKEEISRLSGNVTLEYAKTELEKE